MRISEVAKLTGLADSNIRFYEKKGLLTPARKAESGYRDYSEEDARRLKLILLYRKMDFSIENIEMLLKGNVSVKDAFQKQEGNWLHAWRCCREPLIFVGCFIVKRVWMI